MSLDQARTAKLRALIRELEPDLQVVSAPTALPGGAAVMSDDGRAYVLIDDGDVSRFGPALSWAWRQVPVSLDVLVDGSPLGAGVVARRAACFARPAQVWQVSGSTVAPAGAADVVAPDAEPPHEMADMAARLAEHGLEVAWEHGVLRGEVLGLEVARTVGDRLEVGVGRHDRLARLEMRPSESLSAALESATAAVRSLRRSEAPIHPANTLARSRWLRSLVVASPSVAGCTWLKAVAPPLPWFDLTEAGAAPAIGSAAGEDRAVVAVCSVGVDLDLVPTAADARLQHRPDADLVLILPEGDDLAVTRELAAHLAQPARIVTVPRGWAAGL